MGFLYDHDARDPLGPLPPGSRLCGPAPPTPQDLANLHWFAHWLEDPGAVGMKGCQQCERVDSLDLEPGQVASCGQHSYVRKGEPREPRGPA